MKAHGVQAGSSGPLEGEPVGGSGPTHQLAQLLGLLRRQALLIVAVVLLGTLLAGLIGLFARPLYTARTFLALQPGVSGAVTLEPQPARPVEEGFVREEMKILASHEMARRTVAALGLVQDPEFRPGPPTLLDELRRQLGSWLRQGLAVLGRASAPPSATSPEEEAVRLFRRRLEVAREEDSPLVAIGFTARDPAKAAQIADGLADIYLRHQVETIQAEAVRSAAWLRQRLDGLRAEVARSEAAIESYRTANGLTLVGETNIIDQQVADSSRELIAAQSELVRRQTDLAFLRELKGPGPKREALPEVMSSPLIADLRRHETELLRSEAELALTLGERHPRLQLVRAEQAELQGKIRREIDRIVANIEAEGRTAQGRVDTLQAQLDALVEARDRKREALLRLNELERDAEAGRRLYELFLQRAREAAERQAVVEPAARILSRAAVPDAPSTPGLAMFAALGLVTSAVGGLVLAILRDRLDDRLRSAAQVRSAFGLPCIAVIPRLDRRGFRAPRRPPGELLDGYIEAMRAILAALHLTGEGAPRMVLVASALPGEGRTTLAASLAAYAARLGRRVLLINLDRQRQNGQGGRPEEVGLIDRLLGDLPFEDLIRRDDALRVDFIASGRQRGDLMALVLNGQLRQLLWRLGGCYDLVIIDSPPILAAADAGMLAPIVDRVVVVARWNATPRAVLGQALEALEEVRATVAGIVLTRAEPGRRARAGYGDKGRRPRRSRSAGSFRAGLARLLATGRGRLGRLFRRRGGEAPGSRHVALGGH